MEQLWASLIQTFGFPVAVLAIFVAAIVRGDLVAGGTHRDALKQRDRLLDLALKQADTARGTMGLAEKAIGHVVD
jgi:hypothetical protein